MKVNANVEIILDSFLKLPRRSQLLFFNDLESEIFDKSGSGIYHTYAISDAFNTSECKSPIEQMLFVALKVCMACGEYEAVPQKEIHTSSGKKYFADFAIEMFEYPGEAIVLVECDGHDFHEKTKLQVKRDNERDYELKMSGYDILHYSGSQIYEDPYKCAEEILEYCNKKVGA